MRDAGTGKGRAAVALVGVLILGAGSACAAKDDLATTGAASSGAVATSALGGADASSVSTAADPSPSGPSVTAPSAPGTTVAGSAPGAGASTTLAAPLVDPASVGANELGDVPVLMYHQLLAQPESVYDRSPDDFRAELVRLASEGYVPITAAEFARGDFSAVPAGKHPVVLTFDDSTTSQFGLGADGSPTPGTAVAILLEVAAQNPGFRPVATMYVNGDPFSDSGGRRTLPWLVQNGFEIGNHTVDHENLKKIDSAEVQAQFADNVAAITAAVPGIEVTTMALPFGISPNEASLAVAGSSGGVSYSHAGVMLVGSNPSPSPFAADFNPAKIPRVRSQGPDGEEPEYGSATWLDRLAANPGGRFTSDGDPARVSFPSARAGDLAPAQAAAANPY